MKIFILGLLSLIVLAACATPKMATNDAPRAAKGFCVANNGIFGILIDEQGMSHPFTCENLRGNIPIRQEDKLPPGLVELLKIDVGEGKKFGVPGTPDPCIDYTVNAQRYYFCWN